MDEHDAAEPPDRAHRRPEGVSDGLVEAVGKMSEAVEWVERARGRLYDFHQMMGHADLLFGEAADALEAAGSADHARMVEHEIVGRNVLDGRWSFQVVEEFDADYYGPVQLVEQGVRNDLMAGRRHVFEAEMKERRRTRDHRAHSSRPESGDEEASEPTRR
jgi:hypothetical protein